MTSTESVLRQPNSGCSDLALIDRELTSGVIPEDLVPRLAAAGVPALDDFVIVETPLGARLLDDGTTLTRRESEFSRYRVVTFIHDFLKGGAIGAVIGSAIPGPGSALGAFLGAAISGARSVVNFNESHCGQVVTCVDGKSTRVPYYLHERARERSAQEIKALLVAADVLGDRIEPISASALLAIQRSPAQAADTNTRRTLKELTTGRRLLADVGATSRYGQPALQLVHDAITAEGLLMRGVPLFVVSVTGVQDKAKSFESLAVRGDEARFRSEGLENVGRTVIYSLDPADVHAPTYPAIALGLPPGLVGVYANSTRYTETVESEEHLRVIERTARKNEDYWGHGKVERS